MPKKTRKKFHFEILSRKRKGEKYFWSRIKGGNYRILYVSEMYTAKHNCLNTAEMFMRALGVHKCSLQDLTK